MCPQNDDDEGGGEIIIIIHGQQKRLAELTNAELAKLRVELVKESLSRGQSADDGN